MALLKNVFGNKGESQQFTPDLTSSEKLKTAEKKAEQFRETIGQPVEQKPKIEKDIPQAAPASVKDKPISAPVKSVHLQKIEAVMQEDLEDIYFKMNDAQRRLFKAEGERTAKEVEHILASGKSVAVKILEVIRRWLKLIPGINKFFIEQEAKIKTGKILEINYD